MKKHFSAFVPGLDPVARILCGFAVLTLLACGDTRHEDRASPGSAVLLENAETRAAFFDAACECEAMLFGTTGALSGDSSVSNERDPDLHAYSLAGASVCRSSGSLRSDNATAQSRITDRDQNHCMEAVSTSEMAASDGKIIDGFCRSNMNYCLGSELQAKADSFASAPGSHQVRSNIQMLARDRFQRAAVEYAATLGFYSHACTGTLADDGPLELHNTVCERLEPTGTPPVSRPLSNIVHARLADSVLQVSRLLRSEVHDLMAASDALTPTTSGSPSLYSADMWGADGPRMEAAARIMGDLDTSSAANTNVQFPTSASVQELARVRLGGTLDLQVPYAEFRAVGGNVRRAVLLLTQHDVPFGVEVNAALGRRRFVTPAELDSTFNAAVFNLLDHRIAADTYLAKCAGGEASVVLCAPRDYAPSTGTSATSGQGLRDRLKLTRAEFLAYANDAFAAGRSPLRVTYGLTPADVTSAIRLLRERFVTLRVTASTRAQVAEGSSAGWELHSARILATDQRTPLDLAQAFARDVSLEGGNSLGLRADPAEPLWVPDSDGTVRNLPATSLDMGVSVPRNWYALDVGRLDRLGASGALHHLRVHLRRLMNLPESAERSFIQSSKLEPVLTTLEEHVGSRFTEWDRWEAMPPSVTEGGVARTWPAYVACLGSACSTPSSAALTLSGAVNPNNTAQKTFWRVWSVYTPTSDTTLAGGSPVFVRTEEDANCLVSRGAMGTCTPATVPTVNSWETNTDGFDGARLGMTRRSYYVLDSSFDAPETDPYYARLSDRLYVLWRTGTGASTSYALIDVVQPKHGVGVHPFEGSLGTLFAEVVARDPENPALPLANSLGFRNDFVPPIENALINNGNGGEDSYATYLDWASTAADQARALVSEARSMEATAFQDERADSALLDEAVTEAQQVTSQACGSAGRTGTCAVPRGSYTLWELGVLPSYDPAQPWATSSAATPEDPSLPEEEVEVTRRARLEGEPDVLPAVACSTFIATLIRTGGAEFDLSKVRNLDSLDGKDWDEFADDYFSNALMCSRYLVLEGLRGVKVRDIPEAVAQAVIREGRAPGSQPETYSAYEGELRVQMIEMHEQLTSLRTAMQQLDATYNAAVRQKRLAVDELKDLGEQGLKKRCRWKKAFKFIAVIAAAAVSVVASVYTGGTTLAIFIAVFAASASATASISMSAMEMQQAAKNNECSNEDDAVRTGGDALSSLMDAIVEIQSYTSAAHSGVRRFAMADASMDTLERTVRLARAREQIQADIRASNSLADVPEWRALQGVTAARARDAILRAQVYAFVARRAVEYRLPVALGQMTRSETFVAAPGTWANDLFVAHTEASGGVPSAPDAYVLEPDAALLRYNQNLRDMVRGYAFTRPFSEGSDVQVINVEPRPTVYPNPSRFHADRLLYKCANRALPAAWDVVVADPNVLTSPPCATVGGVDLGGVEYAETMFDIPARLEGYFGDRLAAGNFNYRHRRLALNVVGADVRDCTVATRPQECARDRFLSFSMFQSGETGIESYERDILWFETNPGAMRGARGLAAARTLTNPLTSADTVLVRDLFRNELAGRALAGSYTVRILGRPEIVWHRIENLQILLDYGFWSRQTQ